MISVDVLTVVAPGQTVMEPVIEALALQGVVEWRHWIVEGPSRMMFESRSSCIARARNEARLRGDAPYAMFLDSDVVLPPRGIERLAFGLLRNPHYAALGINYQTPTTDWSAHVAMGAVLFHRCILKTLRFRTEPGRCECSCCCDDLRALGYEIDYLPGIRARHLRDEI